jgi:hypothetical protein
VRYPPPIQLKACIYRIACISYCARDLPSDEFRFTDAGHATLYDARVNTKTPIAACESCIDAFKQTLQ